MQVFSNNILQKATFLIVYSSALSSSYGSELNEVQPKGNYHSYDRIKVNQINTIHQNRTYGPKNAITNNFCGISNLVNSILTQSNYSYLASTDSKVHVYKTQNFPNLFYKYMRLNQVVTFCFHYSLGVLTAEKIQNSTQFYFINPITEEILGRLVMIPSHQNVAMEQRRNTTQKHGTDDTVAYIIEGNSEVIHIGSHNGRLTANGIVLPELLRGSGTHVFLEKKLSTAESLQTRTVIDKNWNDIAIIFGNDVLNNDFPDSIKQSFASNNSRNRNLKKLSDLKCELEKYPTTYFGNGSFVKFHSPSNLTQITQHGAVKCGWKLAVEENRKIRIICPVFKLSKGDVLILKDYKSNSTKRYTETSSLKNVTSYSNRIFIGFISEKIEVNSSFTCLARSLPQLAVDSNSTDVQINYEPSALLKKLGKPYQEDLVPVSKPNVLVSPLVTASVVVSPTSHWLLNLKQTSVNREPIVVNRPYALVNRLKTYTVRGTSLDIF